MGYIANNSATGTIDAILTRKGRAILTSNTQVFRIVKFALADDEINYQIFNPISIDQDDPNIVNLPISEPSTNESNELINKIWLNQTFLGQQFLNPDQGIGQVVQLTTQGGNKLLLYSDDTVRKVSVWFSTLNALDRPFVADTYRIKFDDSIDCYSLEFTSPVLSDTINNNYTKLSNSEYIFTAAKADGSGKYDRTTLGSPSVVFNVRFSATPSFYNLIQKPENKQSVTVSNFITVTQLDSARNTDPNVKPASINLEIKNII